MSQNPKKPKIQDVRRWWSSRVNSKPVWRTAELPAADYKRILCLEGLAVEIRRDVIGLTRPDGSKDEFILSHYWDIVARILVAYEPYAISGVAALLHHLGDQSIGSVVEVVAGSSSKEIKLGGTRVVIEKKDEFFSEAANFSEEKTPRGYPVVYEAVESLLASAKLRIIRDHPEIFSAFLKAVHFKKDVLEKFLIGKPRPVYYLRLALMLEDVGRRDLAEFIRGKVKAVSNRSISKAELRKQAAIPPCLRYSARLSDSPAIVRFREQMRIYGEFAAGRLKSRKLPKLGIDEIVDGISQTRKHDAYHSSTIEGYRVSEDEIDAILAGREISEAGDSAAEVRKKMELKGYLEAHQYLTDVIRREFDQGVHNLSEPSIKEIYAHIFKPSLEAGLIEKEALTRYRRQAVFIRGSTHVPPNHEVVGDLMACFVEELTLVANPLARAVLAHYGFVTIHPYSDGNGRVARFLMNYILCVAGLPWITILVDDRDRYFAALEQAQCRGDFSKFLSFIEGYLG